MFNAKESSFDGLKMLDGAICTFMGSGFATIASYDEYGVPQSITLSADAMQAAMEAERGALGDGAVGAFSYRLIGGGLLAFTEHEVSDSSVIVTADDLQRAVAVLAN